jgi:hypothetical protein
MRNQDVVRAVTREHTGSGVANDPYVFEDDGVGTGGERFRKHVFEAIMHAALTNELKCIFKFGIHGTLYEVALGAEPQLEYGVAMDIDRALQESRIMPHKNGTYVVGGVKIGVEEYHRVRA